MRLSESDHCVQILAMMTHNILPRMPIDVHTLSMAARLKFKMMEPANCSVERHCSERVVPNDRRGDGARSPTHKTIELSSLAFL